MDMSLTHGSTESSETATPNNELFWTEGEEMPTPRTEVLAEAINGKIYAIAGVDYSEGGAGQLDIVEVYDTTNNVWIGNAEPLPVSIDHSAAVQFEGKIYIVGGFRGMEKKPSDTLFIYDPSKDEWTEGARLPSPRGALAADFVNGTLYAYGGLDSSQTPVTTNWAYSPRNNTWAEKAPMPTARHHVASAVVDGKIYAIGGRTLGDGEAPPGDVDVAESNFNVNEMYDPKTDTWITKQPMLEKRSGFGAAAYNGQIYVFGGQAVDGVFESVEKYDPSSDKWTNLTSLPSPRMGLEAVPVGNKIYTIGGQISGNDGLISLDVNEILNFG